jgi:hypothetical protein
LNPCPYIAIVIKIKVSRHTRMAARNRKFDNVCCIGVRHVMSVSSVGPASPVSIDAAIPGEDDVAGIGKLAGNVRVSINCRPARLEKYICDTCQF